MMLIVEFFMAKLVILSHLVSRRHIFGTSMLSGLRRFGDWLGQFPSVVFGLAYLAAIPLFAFVYTLFPFDFYHSTARYEPLVAAQIASLADKLRQRFITDVRQGTTIRPSINGELVPLRDDLPFPLFSINVESERIRVIARFFTAAVSGLKDSALAVALDIDEMATLAPDMATWDEKDLSKLLYLAQVKALILSGDDVQLPMLFPCGKYMSGKTCLRVTYDEFFSLQSLRSTAAGSPTALQSSYLRMLYFSAVTMSTLGYGDIVPVTSRSRAVVTIEVILGPLFFGLFLNSLAKERVAPVT
jgi:hypothetical protein